MLISAQYEVLPGKRRHQHEQRRLGKMKIRQEPANDPELESRNNEEPCFAAAGRDTSVVIGRRTFKSADAGRSYCDDSASLIEGPVDR